MAYQQKKEIKFRPENVLNIRLDYERINKEQEEFRKFVENSQKISPETWYRRIDF